MAKQATQSLSPAQLEIMQVIWTRGEAGVAEIWEELGKARPVARNTVQTTLTRLEAKGWLKYRREGNAFVYSAARPRGRVLGGLVKKLVDTAFGGSASSMVLSLIKDGKLSDEDARQIKQIIDRAAAGRKK